MRWFSLIFLMMIGSRLSGQAPFDTDSICEILVYTGGFDESGLAKGANAQDFTLYNINGEALNFESENLDKPVLLISGSYTCPVFRNKISKINEVWQDYKSEVDIYVIYAVEAHPETDVSPYSGNVWTTQQNVDDDVLYRQAKTYGDRKLAASDMINATGLLAPVYLDLPCNNWWSTFGPAPQNAYLINTEGVIFSKHGWFDRSPNNITCDLDSLLYQTSCGPSSNQGMFAWNLVENDTVNGMPNAVLTIKGNLVNLSNTENVTVGVYRLQNNIPQGWESAMCIDICLDSEVDTTYVTIAPGDTQAYIMYFYTDDTPNVGTVRMGFKNENRTGNQVAQYFYGSTEASVGLVAETARLLKTFPNPNRGNFQFQAPEDASFLVELIDVNGVVVYSQNNIYSGTNVVSNLPSGLYFYRLYNESQTFRGKIIIQ